MHLNQLDDALSEFKMALSFDITEEQRLKIYYAEGLTYERKNSPEAINKFKLSLNLISDKKSNDLYLSALYHLAISQHANKKYF
jgi:tetratricopeptide (TPR) repeat protein